MNNLTWGEIATFVFSVGAVFQAQRFYETPGNNVFYAREFLTSVEARIIFRVSVAGASGALGLSSELA